MTAQSHSLVVGDWYQIETSTDPLSQFALDITSGSVIAAIGPTTPRTSGPGGSLVNGFNTLCLREGEFVWLKLVSGVADVYWDDATPLYVLVPEDITSAAATVSSPSLLVEDPEEPPPP